MPGGALRRRRPTLRAPASVALAGHLGVVSGTCITASGALITCDAHGTLIVWDGDPASAGSGWGGRETSGGPTTDALPGEPGALSGSGGGAEGAIAGAFRARQPQDCGAARRGAAGSDPL